MKLIQAFLVVLALTIPKITVATPDSPPGFVAQMRMNMMILPGTASYLKSTISDAAGDGAKIVVVSLDTPGGILATSQEMIQEIFESPIPVVIYVAPSGATATSAGVFITMAGHVAAMAPGTSIGAAHPVNSDGKDIEGDMRAKAENMTAAMVKSISNERGRNAAWAEKAVKESSSLTETEAYNSQVVDLIAENVDSLLRQLKGRKVKLQSGIVTLEDYSQLSRREYQPSFKEKTINILANPNVAALLWLAATTCLSIELYSPGAILPAVVGIICLILALSVSQIIPVTQTGIMLLVAGSIMIGSELFITSGVLGVGGIVAIILGSVYLIDEEVAPGMSVTLSFIIPLALLLASCMLALVYSLVRTAKRRELTGFGTLIGQSAKALSNFSGDGKVFINGETWKARIDQGIAEKGESLNVIGVKEGMVLLVEKVKREEIFVK